VPAPGAQTFRAELLARESCAIRNYVFGLLMPQVTLPSISDPGLVVRTLKKRLGQRRWVAGMALLYLNRQIGDSFCLAGRRGRAVTD
jgi:hypothetical protein